MFYPSELRAHDGKRWRPNTWRLLKRNRDLTRPIPEARLRRPAVLRLRIPVTQPIFRFVPFDEQIERLNVSD